MPLMRHVLQRCLDRTRIDNDDQATATAAGFKRTASLLNVIVGKCSTSRKSGDFRCPSRWLSCVLRVLASMVAWTEEAVKSCSLKSITASTPVKAPLTVMMPICLRENSTWVCIGPVVQVITTLHVGSC